MNQLTEEEKIRYERQIKLPDFGLDKQLLLKNSRVLIVGAGGLGCPVAIYLAASGVGTIGIVDHDKVELSNLHRQIAYGMKDVGRFKADALKEALLGMNPNISCHSYKTRLEASNVADIITEYDLVIDGTDNFQTRFLIGDACHFLKIPLLHGAVHQYAAQIILFAGSAGPCFRCLYNQPPLQSALAACNEAGILGVVTGAAGSVMALEAIKHLAHLTSTSLGKLLRLDTQTSSIKPLALERDTNCPACGDNPQITSIESSPICSTQTPQTDPFAGPAGEISTETAKELLARGAHLLDVREIFEFESGHVDNAISLPLSQLPFVAKERLSSLASEKPLVVYCKSGKRSLAALSILQQLGYPNCYSVAGGIEAWY
jgi:adenylyltransferase/sulfurtransferase